MNSHKTIQTLLVSKLFPHFFILLPTSIIQLPLSTLVFPCLIIVSADPFLQPVFRSAFITKEFLLIVLDFFSLFTPIIALDFSYSA